MKIENRYALPESIVEAVKRDTYRKAGDISVTALIGPPRIRQLEIRHADEIVEDASERIWSLLGQSIHAILERAALKNSLSEERMTDKVLGWTVSGQPDILDADGTLSDYKVCSTWAVKNELKEEWKSQLNCYAWLYRKHGFEVKKAQIVSILRDWSSTQALREKSYPQAPVAVIPVSLWPDDRMISFIQDRVLLHQEAEKSEEENLADCSPSERWERPTTWAVMREGRKTAKRVFDNENEAVQSASSIRNFDKTEYAVVKRPGESVRCARFCKVAPFCNQWQEMKKNSLDKVPQSL